MKYLILLVVAALIGASIYASSHSPKGCLKLQNDLRAEWPTIQEDLVAIFSKRMESRDPLPPADAAEPPIVSPANLNPSPQHDVLPATNSEPDSQPSAYADAMGKSKETGKNILVIFEGSDWSAASQQFDQQVRPNPGWSEFAEGFVMVTLQVPQNAPADNGKKSPNQILADKFGVSHYPTLIAIDPNEKELKRLEGYSATLGVGPLIETFNPYAR
jgi:hypothetical protein